MDTEVEYYNKSAREEKKVLKPKYAENIIVGARYSDRFSWYISDITEGHWLLDMEREYREFDELGLPLTRDEFFAKRRIGIVVVNKKNAKEYLSSLEHEKVTASELKELLKEAEDLDDFFPSLYVDFDHEIIYDNYPEFGAFETHAPKDWKYSYEVRWKKEIPQEEQYWMEDGKDLLIGGEKNEAAK